MSTEYRIEFSITRRVGAEDDFTEIGFGSSGAWERVNAALYAAESAIQRREWETTGDMPDPATVDGAETIGAKPLDVMAPKYDRIERDR